MKIILSSIVAFIIGIIYSQLFLKNKFNSVDKTEAITELEKEYAYSLEGEWLLDAEYYEHNKLIFAVPGNEGNAGFAIYNGSSKSQFPVLRVDDTDRNGIADQFSFIDSLGRFLSLRINEEEAKFDYVTVTDGTDVDKGYTYVDQSFDGFCDLRISDSNNGEQPSVPISADLKWKTLIVKEGKKMVTVNGELREIELVNGGVYRLRE